MVIQRSDIAGSVGWDTLGHWRDLMPWNIHSCGVLSRMWKRHNRNPRREPIPPSPSDAENWARLFHQLDRIEKAQTMADLTLDDILAATTAEQTADASIVTLLQGVEAQLATALAGQGISPAAQAKINTIFANMQANIGTITAAVTANTPAAPAAPAATPAPAAPAS